MYTAARVNWAVVYDAKTIRQSSLSRIVYTVKNYVHSCRNELGCSL